MADWYVSSVAYAAMTSWQATHAYTVGALIKPTSPATAQEYAYRCTTAGTSGGSEPAWSGAKSNNSTINDGTATWTNVSGQSTYNWSAPLGSLYATSTATFADRTAVGDRIFLSSDHAESGKGSQYGFNSGANAYGLIEVISVSRAGSVPPVPADITSGASITMSTGSPTIEAYCNMFWQGISFTNSAGTNFYWNTSAQRRSYFRDCSLYLNSATTNLRYTTPGCASVVLDNTTLKFGATAQCVAGASEQFDLMWMNTPSAIAGATIPATLFDQHASSAAVFVTCRGVDLSAITGTLVGTGNSSAGPEVLLDSCKIASGVTRYATSGANSFAGEQTELVNCYDGTTTCLNERYTPAGAVTTERTITLSGGAADDVGGYSLKMVSSSRSDFISLPLDSFWLDVENTSTGSSKTATVEIVSSASLNNVDICLLLEYMGTTSSSVTSFTSSLATQLTASAAVTTSSATWNSSPSTPVYQKLQVTFTPQTAGRVRGLVRLGKTSKTVYVNPQVTIT